MCVLGQPESVGSVLTFPSGYDTLEYSRVKATAVSVHLRILFVMLQSTNRQGDPLPPLLFVLAADLLQSLLNKARQQGWLKLPIPVQHTLGFPILQYADDTLIIMEGCPVQLFFLKSLLNYFATSTGLKVNYAKSMMVPINIQQDRLQLLATTFGCSIDDFPFTYLGIPLSLSKPCGEDF